MQQLTLFDTPVVELTTGRRAMDFYETPRWMPETVFEYVTDISGIIFECCVGDWAIASVIKERFPHANLVTNDLDPNRTADFHFDARDKASWENCAPMQWVVTNPPYGADCAPIVINAFNHASVGVIVFVRSTFLDMWEDREDWLCEHPPSLVVGMPRYAFRRNDKGKWAYDSAPVWGVCWRKDDVRYYPGFVMRSRRSIPGFYKNPDKGLLLVK